MSTYYQITTRQKNSQDFCYVRSEPDELGLSSWKLGRGVAFGAEYPPAATLKMASEDPGIELTSFVGNTCGMLVVDAAVADVMQRLVSPKDAEFLAVSIVNHRGRVASDGYRIVNPLGSHDVLNHKSSKITYLGSDVVSVDEIVLDPAKLAGRPHLFRLRESPIMYFISAALLEELRKLQPKPTNASLFTYPEVPSP